MEQFAGNAAVMEGEAAHHLGRVLRAQVGQLYELSDGQRVWLGQIESVGRDCPNRTLLRNTLYGATFGSIMHKSDNTRIYVHIQVDSCKLIE